MSSRLTTTLIAALAALALLSTAGAAAPLNVTLYDTTPEVGKALSLGVSVFPLYADQRNLKQSVAGGAVALARDAGGRLAGDFVFSPKEALRYAAIFDIRVDGWRLVDRRTVYIDYRKSPKLSPFTFHARGGDRRAGALQHR